MSAGKWCVVLAAAIARAFSSGIRAPLYFDDDPSIEGNPSIRQLTTPAALLNPPPNTTVAGRPVVNVSPALNYAVNEFFGVDQRPGETGSGKTGPTKRNQSDHGRLTPSPSSGTPRLLET